MIQTSVKPISKDKVKQHSYNVYVYASNLEMKNLPHQGEEICDLPNALGIPLSVSSSHSFNDLLEELQQVKKSLDIIEDHLKAGTTVVILWEDISAGMGSLKKGSPIIYSVLSNNLSGFFDRYAMKMIE